MAQEYLMLDNVKFAKIPKCNTILISHAINPHSYAKRTKYAMDTIVEVINVVKVMNAHMIGKHVQMDNVQIYVHS